MANKKKADSNVEAETLEKENEAGLKTEDKNNNEVESKGSQESELDKAIREKEEYLDMLRRERADFENYKKRNASLSSASYLNGCIEIIDKILPVMDNFERALADSDQDDSFVKGISMIHRQLADALKSAGVIELDVLGQEFNPETMNAVMQTECQDDQEPGMVSEVMQKGYKIQDKILRHAMVKVTK